MRVYGKRPPPLLPALGLEGSWPGYGHLALYVPNSAKRAIAAARGEWGYPAFSADLAFEANARHLRCEVWEGGQRVYSLRVKKRGPVVPVTRTMHTYAVREGSLVRGTWLRSGYARLGLGGSAAELELGSVHPVARALGELDLDPRPILSAYALDYQTVQLPGEVLERGVRPLEGYRGAEGDGSLRDQPCDGWSGQVAGML